MPLIPLDDPLLRGGSGSTYYKFTTLGETVQGSIVDARKTQQTDYDTNEKLTFDNGDPRMQIVVTVQTQFRDPSNPEDKGMRDLYIKGQQPTQALSEAIKAVGADGLDLGGTLVMQFTHEIPNVRNGRSGFPSKGFAFAYTPPPALAVGQIAQAVVNPQVLSPQPQYAGGTMAQQPVYAQPVAQPVFQQPQIPGVNQLMGQQPAAQPVAQPVVQQPAAPAAAPGLTPEQIAALAALSPEQRVALGLPQ